MEDQNDVLGRRIGAGLIDLLITFVLFLVIGLITGGASSGENSASVNLGAGATIVFFVATLLYYGVSEATAGQTVGKRVLGIRVVRADGSRPSTGQIVIRTLLRIIDGILFYLVAVVAIAATGRRRARLGDLAAKTTVVRS